MRAILLSLTLLLAGAMTPQAHAQAALPGLTEGVEYQRIEGGAPYRPVPGKIEVAEVFAYWCPHCAHFDPMLQAWKRTLPASARMVVLPLASGPDDAWSRMFFAAEASKTLAVLHPRLFASIHETGELPRTATLPQIAAYAARVKGVDAKALAAALKDSRAIDAGMEQAHAFALRSQIQGTPSLVIDGKYLVLGNNYQALLDNATRILKALTPPATPAKRPATPSRS